MPCPLEPAPNFVHHLIEGERLHLRRAGARPGRADPVVGTPHKLPGQGAGAQVARRANIKGDVDQKALRRANFVFWYLAHIPRLCENARVT